MLKSFIKICRENLKWFEIGQIMRNVNFKEFMTNGYIFTYYDNYLAASLSEDMYLL